MNHRLSVFWLYFLAAMAWGFMLFVVNNRADWDLWGVMSFGALLDQNPGRFPYRDPFSYTAFGHPWVYHEWGSGVVFFQLFKHLGSPALFWLKTLLTAIIILVASHRMLFSGLSRRPLSAFQSVVFNLALPPSVYLLLPLCSITVRCHLFSYLGFALFLWILDSHRAGMTTQPAEPQPVPAFRLLSRSRLPWLLPLLMVLWVNLHGGFITGLIAVGAYWLAALYEKRRSDARQLGLVLLLCLGAVLVNPYGVDFVTTMIAAWSLPRDTISEWGNVFTLDIPHYAWLYMLLLTVSVGLGIRHWLRNRRRFPAELVLLTLTGLNGALHHKLCPFFLITLLSAGFNLVPPMEGKTWTPRMQTMLRFLRPVYAYALPLLIMLPALVLTAMFQMVHPNPFTVRVPGPEADDEGVRLKHIAYPLGATAFLHANRIHGNLWTSFTWGEFLYWTLTPRMRVSIDGRYETVYPQSVYEDFRDFYMGRQDLSAAFRYPTTHMLVPTDQPRLFGTLENHPEWRRIYSDNQVAIYTNDKRRDYIPVPVPATLTLDALKGDLSRFRLAEKSHR